MSTVSNPNTPKFLSNDPLNEDDEYDSNASGSIINETTPSNEKDGKMKMSVSDYNDNEDISISRIIKDEYESISLFGDNLKSSIKDDIKNETLDSPKPLNSSLDSDSNPISGLGPALNLNNQNQKGDISNSVPSIKLKLPEQSEPNDINLKLNSSFDNQQKKGLHKSDLDKINEINNDNSEDNNIEERGFKTEGNNDTLTYFTEDDDSQVQWEESLNQLHALVNFIVLPLVGKMLGRRFANLLWSKIADRIWR
ncbi:Mim2p ASCRUDRAFT_74806 [Ascoidea rubescens DSM 1968]|uniref:Uncharacterized protein n=1 Tax=Ascoidea rubescens DSM 1968 TaxID=1344418 RepID=A0A1D2VLG5_9ASCO|nr:hypothetical protein ASCRUDRAFT_74806 [Ascoidea rubescens DSM 1968]ODV62424.1 hypothetical protein ASCRUDRAFT_74806 [Ascoidea rubescens DSM 1968]